MTSSTQIQFHASLCIGLLPLFLSSTFSHAKEPIWKPSSTPSPLPIVRLVPGQEVRVSLLKSTLLNEFEILGFVYEDDFADVRMEDSDAIVVIAKPGTDALSVIDVDVQDPKGNLVRLSLPVVIEALPLVDFHFKPETTAPTSVFLAGSFNGWSGSADPLVPDNAGVFRLQKAIHPGSHTYKFVIDGEWVADPSNPETDGTGFGNSVLRVEGEVGGVFEFHPLSALMPNVGPQGGFHATADLDHSSITVLLNNRRTDDEEWTYHPDTNMITFNFPEDRWLAENFVTVLGRSTDDRTGISMASFDFASAPRSPRDEVIYFPMTDRFFDGDPSNNPPRGLPNVHPIAEYHGGDWAGIRAKLREGYFQRLGVTTLWISPPNENTPKVEQESVPPGNYFTSYHGYWPTSFTETNPPFGTMEELRGLVEFCHQQDIAVLLDFVSNHVHEDHPLFQADPSIAVPLQLPSGEDNIRKFNEHPFTTWFDTFLPTLDYEGRPDLIPVMADNAINWLRETNADGFRHDAVKHVPLPFWRILTRRLRNEVEIPQGRRLYQVGETISGHATVAEFVGPDLLDGQFDFPTYFAVQNVIARGEGGMRDLASALLDGIRIYPPSAIMSPLLGNHDMGRFVAYADGDLPAGSDESHIAFHNPPEIDNEETFTRLRLGFAFLASVPGPPMVYYGDEIGLSGASDPDNRRPMQWSNWSDQQKQTFDHVAAMNHLRIDSIALRRGNLQVLHAGEESLVLARIAPEQVVIAALIRKARPATLLVEPPAPWSGMQLHPIASHGATADMDGAALGINGTDWSWGFWEARW